MSGVAGMIWCGASAPVVQGFLVGLGVAATGLMVFPFDFRIGPPPSGPVLDHAKADQALRWSRRLSWLLAALTAVTIAGYVMIFVSASGKFCGVAFSTTTERLIIIWMLVVGLTLITLAVSARLRRQARRIKRTSP